VTLVLRTAREIRVIRSFLAIDGEYEALTQIAELKAEAARADARTKGRSSSIRLMG